MSPELPPAERLIAIEEAARKLGRGRSTLDRWIRLGLLTPYKKRGSRQTHLDLAELPEAMRRAGKPGPKPRRTQQSDS
jgi:predicted DNA-binding transcriptional regulator AlpA